jgi:hypothetical protein
MRPQTTESTPHQFALEKDGLRRFGHSIVNLNRLLVVNLREAQGCFSPMATLTFDTGQDVHIPYADGLTLLNYFALNGGGLGGTVPDGTQAQTESSAT